MRGTWLHLTRLTRSHCNGFVQNCTLDMVKAAWIAFLRSGVVKNERVKRARDDIHHALNAASQSVAFLKDGFAAALGRDIGLEKLCAKTALRSIPNQRVAADDLKRRTFTDEEMQAMFEVVQDDARWSLLLRLLREIGLRLSCLCHLKYKMLLDETHMPRHACRVPEKARTWRTFVTSTPMKQAINRYAETLRDVLARRR